MKELLEEEREKVVWGKKVARRLFGQMGAFDRFDLVLTHLSGIVAEIRPEDVKYVLAFYDLGELAERLRDYARRCSELAEAVEKLLGEGMGCR